MANQKNGDPYVVLNPTIETLRKEKEATERVNEKLLNRIVEEKQCIQWYWNDWDKECVILRKRIKEQEEEMKELKRLRDIAERMDAQAPVVEPNPKDNSEDGPKENLGDDLVIDIEDDPEEVPNYEW
ncbi:hypothetical protein ACH5RR_015651 [Cinchona calisaya]|uniref:Uncharacterized protein n=1 Tax=Cinchona calisaya TaxID=153742 RepID=A0ABD2ZWF2_9GENT